MINLGKRDNENSDLIS